MLPKFLVIPSSIEGTQGHFQKKPKAFQTPFNPCDYFSLLAALKRTGLIFFFHIIHLFIYLFQTKTGAALYGRWLLFCTVKNLWAFFFPTKAEHHSVAHTCQCDKMK